MIKVVDKGLSKVMYWVDAWRSDAMKVAAEWIADNGYTVIGQEITMMGDMVIFVK